MAQWPAGAMADSFKRATFMVNVIYPKISSVKAHMDNPKWITFC